MNSFRPSHSRTSCFGRVFPIWAACLLAVFILAITASYVTWPSAAERACREGDDLLQAGRNGPAAEEFRRAIALDPHLDRAWHGLLAAQPTLDVCRRLADARPELFDMRQPVRDDAILPREPGWIAERWRRSLDLYEKIVLAEPAASGAATAAVLRLDLAGRKEVAEAWDELRRLEREARTSLRKPLPPATLRVYAARDLAGAQEAVAGAITHFRTPKLWLDHFTRLKAVMKQYKSGVARLEQAAKTAPLFLPTQLTLGYIDIVRGRAEAAARRCRKLLDARTGSLAEPRIRYALARALEMSGNSKDAAAEIEHILRLRPGNREAMVRLGSLYLRLGRMDEASRLARTILELRPGDPKASHIQGVVSLHRGDYETAAIRLKEALRNDPGNLNIRFALARAAEASGNRVAAFNDFMVIASALRAERPGWVFAAGSATALAAANGPDAVKAADKALADKFTMAAHPELHGHVLRFKFAGAAMQGGELLAGLSVGTLTGQGSNDELDNYLIAGVLAGRAYAAADAKVAPDERHLAFFKSQPKDASAQYSLAFLLAASGQETQAREALEKFHAAHPEHQLGALHLARLYLIEGKTELAARTLRQIKRTERSPEIAREIALIDSLQGVRILNGVDEPSGASGVPGMVGPHFAFFSVAVHAGHRALARRVVLLDPTSDASRAILRLTYSYVRQHGPEGVVRAAKAEQTIDQAISRLVARYRADGGKLYRLAIGSFWDDLPAQL